MKSIYSRKKRILHFQMITDNFLKKLIEEFLILKTFFIFLNNLTLI